jgi:hypothetical protein
MSRNMMKSFAFHEMPADLFLIWFSKTFSYREILFNSPFWPSTVNEADKASYKKGSVVKLKIAGEFVPGVVIWRGAPNAVKKVITSIESIISDYDEGEVTDHLLSTNLELPKATKRQCSVELYDTDCDSESEQIIQSEFKRRSNLKEQFPDIQHNKSFFDPNSVNGNFNSFNLDSSLISKNKLSNKSVNVTCDNETPKSSDDTTINLLQNILKVNVDILEVIKRDVIRDIRTVGVHIKKLRTEFTKEDKLSPFELCDDSNEQFTDLNGNIFKVSDLQFVTPKKFAAAFVEKVNGNTFLPTHVIEPAHPSQSSRLVCPPQFIQTLRRALGQRFKQYDWETVKNYLNQQGRDKKKKSHSES